MEVTALPACSDGKHVTCRSTSFQRMDAKKVPAVKKNGAVIQYYNHQNFAASSPQIDALTIKSYVKLKNSTQYS